MKALIIDASVKSSAKAGFYHDLTVKVEGGKILACKAWKHGEETLPAVGEVYELTGKADMWNGVEQFTITGYQLLEEVDRGIFAAPAPFDVDTMYAELIGLLSDHIKNKFLIGLISKFDFSYGERFTKSQAAVTHHHAYAGGLLKHTATMARIAIKVAPEYNGLNLELLLIGVLLHDIGKIKEIQNGIFSQDGVMEGHIFMSAMIAEKFMDKIDGFPSDMRQAITHMILSHHGKKEWGSPVEPATQEAKLLHLIDMMDSQVEK